MPKAEAEELAMQQLEIVKIPEQADKYPGVGLDFVSLVLLLVQGDRVRLHLNNGRKTVHQTPLCLVSRETNTLERWKYSLALNNN